MDAPVVTALAALAGAVMGGFTTVVTSWLLQRAQAREQRLAHYQLRRQDLYKEFIEQASTLYIDALQSDKPDVSGLMRLYAEISRMRVLPSPAVVASAEQIVKGITNAYLNPNKTIPELRQMADTAAGAGAGTMKLSWIDSAGTPRSRSFRCKRAQMAASIFCNTRP